MVARRKSRERAGRNHINGSLTLRGRDYPFYLEHQQVELGNNRTAQFYFMPPALLRGDDPELHISNFRSCIGFWDAAMHELGVADDPHQQRHRVMAISYALVNRDKAQQTIYRDAFLRAKSFKPEEVSLPDHIRHRIRQAVDSHDRNLIKEELDQVLEASTFPKADLLGLQQAFATWADKGVNAYRLRGDDGVVEWLQEVDYWLHKFRKRSSTRVRNFINFFSYQAKVSFYLCFANFWRSLIPWLQEHHGLDEFSSRFLSLWHNQNQPIEIPHGRTLGGIYYPTSRGVQLWLPDENGNIVPQQMAWKTEHIGPTHLPDVFSGQVLSLHPLGWCLLSDNSLREMVGRYLSSPRFEAAQQSGMDNVPEYWSFVDAVLTAAHLYSHSRLSYENQRGQREVGSSSTSVAVDTRAPSPEVFLRRFVADRQFLCQCGEALTFVRLQTSSSSDEPGSDLDEESISVESRSCTLSVRCSACGSATLLEVPEQDLEAYLFDSQS